MSGPREAARGVTLLHGFTGSARSWGREITDGLASAGFVPHPLDLPGHGARAGEVDPELFTLEATLAGIGASRTGPRPLVGYSMGGRIALHFAAAHPGSVTHLVLESASPGLETARERSERRVSDEVLADHLVSGGIEAFVTAWEALPLFTPQRSMPPGVRATLRRARLSNVPESLAASLRGLGTGALPSLWGRLGEIEIPTLIVVGELDSKFRAIGERMASGLPNARLAVVERAGHTVHLERPRRWCEEVVAFLA